MPILAFDLAVRGVMAVAGSDAVSRACRPMSSSVGGSWTSVVWVDHYLLVFSVACFWLCPPVSLRLIPSI